MLKAWETSPTDTAGRWTVTIDDLLPEDIVDGLTIRIRLNASYNKTFNTLTVNGFGPKLVYYRQNERLTTHVGQYSEVLLTYRAPHEETINNVVYNVPGAANADYTNNNVNYGKDGWVLDASYSDGNNYDRLLNSYERHRVGSELTEYKLCMIDVNGLLQPVSIGDTTAATKTANATPLLPGRILYYNSSSTVAVNGVTAQDALYEDVPTKNVKYTINTDLPAYSDLYFVGTFNSDNLFVLDTTFYKVVTPPSDATTTLPANTFTKGKYYIYVGSSYSSKNYLHLLPTHQIYYCDDSEGKKIYAVTQRPHYTRTSVGSIEWDAASNEYLITKGALAYWNGAYSGTTSNLEYTKVGKLGSIATAQKGTWLTSRVAYAAADDEIDTADSLYTTGANLAVNKTSITSGYTFEVNGKSRYTDEIYINTTSDTSGTADTGALIIGNKAGPNIAFDSNEIMARNNKAAATLFINHDGGIVQINNNTSSDGGLYIYNTVDATHYDGSDGALRTTGGVSIAKSIRLGQKLYLGNNTQSAADADSGIHIPDNRNVNHLPNTFGDQVVQWYFDNAVADTGRTGWSTVMHMKGWKNSHAAHQISFNAEENNVDGNIYHRSGYNNTWATWNVNMADPSATQVTTTWRKLLDNVNINEKDSPFRITTINKTNLILDQTWKDTGIAGNNIPVTGSYIIQVFINTSTANTFIQANEYYTGFMSWYAGTCQNADDANGADEIILHRAGANSGGKHIYLRTIRVANGSMKLQIKGSTDSTVATPIYFRFRQVI